MKAGTIAVVEWVDASYDEADLRVHELSPLITLVTVGWLLREDKTSISLGMDYSPEGDRYRHITHTFPRAES